MDKGQRTFYERVRSLDRKHRDMERGYDTVIRPDGLIVAKPRRMRVRFSLKPVVFGIVGFYLFKSFFVAQLGTEVYADRVARLDSGTVVERAGAWVMQPDRLSEWIAAEIKPYLP